MTPACCARLRRAAALLHSIPGLRATVGAPGVTPVTITSEAAHDHGDTGTPPGRCEHGPHDRCHPCLFRRTVVTASAHVEVGNKVGLFGLGVDVEPTIELFGEGQCRLNRSGVVSWGFDFGDTVLCIATLLDPSTAMEVVRGLSSTSPAIALATDDDRGRGTCTRVDFSYDDELDVTLVYAIVATDDDRGRDAALATLVRLMAMFGAEEIAADPGLLAVAS